MVAFELSETVIKWKNSPVTSDRVCTKGMKSAKFDFLTELFIKWLLGEGVAFLGTLFPSRGQETSVRYDDWGFLLLLSTKIFFLLLRLFSVMSHFQQL